MKNWHIMWLAAISTSLLVILLTPAFAFTQGPGMSVSIANANVKDFPVIETIVSVLDANGLAVPNLTADNFQLLEDARAFKVKSAKTLLNEDAPVAVCLAIDVSGSMAGQAIEDAKAAANSLVGSLGPKDRVCVIAFSDKVDISSPFVFNPAKEANLASDRNLLKNLINTLVPDSRPGTPLYDAALKAIKVAATQPPGTRAVILITDGKDERLGPDSATILPGSISTPDRPIAVARESHIPVFAIGLGKEIDSRYLQRLAEETGGRYQETPTSGKLREMFLNIRNQLKTQYAITYSSSLFPDGKEHVLQVRVRSATGQSEGSATFNLPRDVVAKPLVRLYYKEGDDRKELVDGQRLNGTITIAPQIATPGAVSSVEYWIDHTPVHTATIAPWTYTWDTNKQPFGTRQLTVRVRDDRGQIGETTARVETVEMNIWQVMVEAPIEYKSGVLVLAVSGIAGLLLFIFRRRSAPAYCPRGLHVMPPGMTECPFCAQEDRQRAAQPPTPIAPFLSPPPGDTEIISNDTMPGKSIPGMQTISLKRQPVNLAFLVMEKGDHPGREFTLDSADAAIGRAATNDIIIDDPTVGRQQAKIKMEGKDYYLYDLAATNPTVVNGKEVKGRRKLGENDRIQMGDIVFVFKQLQSKNQG